MMTARIPTFLEKCVAVLDRDPGVVLSPPNLLTIDDRGDRAALR